MAYKAEALGKNKHVDPEMALAHALSKYCFCLNGRPHYASTPPPPKVIEGDPPPQVEADCLQDPLKPGPRVIPPRDSGSAAPSGSSQSGSSQSGSSQSGSSQSGSSWETAQWQDRICSSEANSISAATRGVGVTLQQLAQSLLCRTQFASCFSSKHHFRLCVAWCASCEVSSGRQGGWGSAIGCQGWEDVRWGWRLER